MRVSRLLDMVLAMFLPRVSRCSFNAGRCLRSWGDVWLEGASFKIRVWCRRMKQTVKGVEQLLKRPTSQMSSLAQQSGHLSPKSPEYWKAMAQQLSGNKRQVLHEWLLQHFEKPYPSDDEKNMLAEATGMSRTQVSLVSLLLRTVDITWWLQVLEPWPKTSSKRAGTRENWQCCYLQVANWFINARVRIWRPLVEELGKEMVNGLACAQVSYSRTHLRCMKILKVNSLVSLGAVLFRRLIFVFCDAVGGE